MAHDMTDLHVLGGGVGASLRFAGRDGSRAAEAWNMAARSAAEGDWGKSTGARSVSDRPAAVLRNALFHRRFEASRSASRFWFSGTGAKLAARRPLREHFVAQKIA
jgi:hypothetical protein